MKRYWTVGLLVFVLAIVLVATGCASRSEVDRLEKENADLQKEVKNLKAQLPPEEQEPEVPAEADQRPNPVANTAANIAAGKALYESSCWVCHGKDGKGDGPAAANLDPKPIDFSTDTDFAQDPDGHLEYIISQTGVPGTGMPAWKDAFSEQQVWTILRYERTLAGQ